MDKINSIDMEFIFKKRGHPPETDQLRTDRCEFSGRVETISDCKNTGSHRKDASILKIKHPDLHRLFNFCKTIGTTPLQEYQQNNYEFWLDNSDESQTSHIQHKKCPPSAFKKFNKHESLNLIRLEQTAKVNTMEAEQKRKTAAAIQKAEKNFALELPMLVEETARDVKLLNAISALESTIKNPRNTYLPNSACYFIMMKT